jgi:heptosyltransferase-2
MPVKALRKIDKYIIWFFILILFWLKYLFVWKKEKLIKNPKKILVIRMRALWSSLLTFPMIKQLEDHYWNWVQYDLLASTRNIWVYKNQWYFKNMYNLFNIKDLLKLICSFKKYDIVIDTEDYFMISAFMSVRLWKINVWYKNIKVRWLAYNNWIMYNDQQHAVLTFIDLAKKVWAKWEIPESLEKLKYTEKDKTKVDEFLKWIDYSKLICMHTWWAETAKERAWPQHKRVELIQKVIDKNNKVKIVLSWTKWESNYVQELISKLPQKYYDNVINICWMFGIFEFWYLLERCDLMVSNDTWPMHLAAAMWTKTIWLFWPEIPRKFGPYPLTKNIWLYKGRWEAYIKVHLWIWEKDTEYSINKIEVDDVLEKIEF